MKRYEKQYMMLICNQGVGGSIPPVGTNKSGVFLKIIRRPRCTGVPVRAVSRDTAALSTLLKQETIMGYKYGKPCQSRRDGKFYYWGKHPPREPVPELVGPFDTAQDAEKHAETHRRDRSVEYPTNRR
jgi:hypothetical protein